MNLTDAIKGRRTIRKFTGEKIDEKDILEMIDLSRYAAFPANIQPLKYMIVNDKKTVNEIFVLTKWAGYLKDGAPGEDERPTAFIAVLGDKELKKDFEVDAGAAITTMLLSAYEKGIGTCWIGAFDKEKVREVLSVPERYQMVYLVALGYPAQKSRAVDMKDGDCKYFLDDENVMNVPKRAMDEIILKR